MIISDIPAYIMIFIIYLIFAVISKKRYDKLLKYMNEEKEKSKKIQ